MLDHNMNQHMWCLALTLPLSSWWVKDKGDPVLVCPAPVSCLLGNVSCLGGNVCCNRISSSSSPFYSLLSLLFLFPNIDLWLSGSVFFHHPSPPRGHKEECRGYLRPCLLSPAFLITLTSVTSSHVRPVSATLFLQTLPCLASNLFLITCSFSPTLITSFYPFLRLLGNDDL